MTLSGKHVNVKFNAAALRLMKKKHGPTKPKAKGAKVMPWARKDAPKHTKAARSAADQKLWSAVANKVLSTTGNDASAIKIANAQVQKRKGKK